MRARTLTRRTLLSGVALAGAGGASWWLRDWLPTRGLLNECLDSRLPDSLADHPAIARALEGLDTANLWDCHVHLLGTGDGSGGDVWVNPVMDSLWHPMQALQKRLYMNASCVTGDVDLDSMFVDRLLAAASPLGSESS